METSWPWLAVAGLGALHGLSPANGWMFAAAYGMSASGNAQARYVQVGRALLPIAIGHIAAIVIVVFAVAQGMWVNNVLIQYLAGALLVGVASHRCLSDSSQRETNVAIGNRVLSNCIRASAGHVGIALWSCLMATAHGVGLMLVPALMPLCMSDTSAGAITVSDSVVLALAAVGVHLAGMLVTTGIIATGVCRSLTLRPRPLSDAALRHAWTAALGVTGVLLMTLR